MNIHDKGVRVAQDVARKLEDKGPLARDSGYALMAFADAFVPSTILRALAAQKPSSLPVTAQQ
jgi:hypothetical protein